MKKNLNEETRKRIRRAARISMCAVLAGGLTLTGIHASAKMTGFNVQAAEAQSTQVALLKNEDSSADARGSKSVADIVEEAMPSVVSISTKSTQELQDYFGMFGFSGFAPSTQEYEVEGGGSGFIVGKTDDEVLIVTNYHVVDGANEIACCFVDNNAYTGVVKGYDEDKDLAVVAVKLSDLSDETLKSISVAKIGSSDDLRVGEQILVLGNALGYGASVTTGIVSAKNRQNLENGGYGSLSEEGGDGINLIQTDAAINPGNSGGPVLNMKGEVVGIGNQKTGGLLVEGMCYAIAISDVEDAMTDIMNQKTREKVEDAHGALGITAGTVPEDAATVYGMPKGALIIDVTEDSAADRAGMEKDTVIVKFDGKKIDSVQKLVELLEYYAPGEEVEVVVAVQDKDSEDGFEEKTYTVTLQEGLPEGSGKDGSGEDREERRDWSEAWGEDGFNLPGQGGYGDWSEWRNWEDQDGRDDRNDEEDENFIFGQGSFGDWE